MMEVLKILNYFFEFINFGDNFIFIKELIIIFNHFTQMEVLIIFNLLIILFLYSINFETLAIIAVAIVAIVIILNFYLIKKYLFTNLNCSFVIVNLEV